MSEIASQKNLPSSEALVPACIIITENAAHKIWELLTEEENFQLKLRVAISGGGCSGFQYNFSFVEDINKDDTVVTKTISQEDARDRDNIVQVLLDWVSIEYLRGAEIDYKSDLSGERFIIRNPNAATTCGCGSSFAIA